MRRPTLTDPDSASDLRRFLQMYFRTYKQSRLAIKKERNKIYLFINLETTAHSINKQLTMLKYDLSFHIKYEFRKYIVPLNLLKKKNL